MSAKQITKTVVDQLALAYPAINFAAGKTFMWNPSNQTILYANDRVNTPAGSWSLLHEVGHALSNHTEFSSDLGLIKIEVEAWNKAKEIAKEFNIDIEEDHIQNCLDSYRDWLKKRSTCPDCNTVNMQHKDKSYKCANCPCKWSVSESQLCSIRSKK